MPESFVFIEKQVRKLSRYLKSKDLDFLVAFYSEQMQASILVNIGLIFLALWRDININVHNFEIFIT